jgi:quinone-modifying oxidoreductase subunit QmoA
MNSSPKVLVIGGGISGISAAVEASEAGADVLLVERNPYLGGRVAQMNLYFPKLCPPACGLEINLRRFKTSPRIRCLTQTEVTRITGESGCFQVELLCKPRFVNEKCTSCGACAEVCPGKRHDEFNLGMSSTPAAYLPFPSAFPFRYVIDRDACPGSECEDCVKACLYDAIDLDMTQEVIQEEVGAIIVATGWQPYDASQLDSLGFGGIPNVITNLQMERLAAPDGPTQGRILKPSDGVPPRDVAFVQCAGSRDENHLRHCSGVCCVASLKQVRYVREQCPEARVFVFYIDIRSPGRLEDFFVETQKDPNLALVKGKVAKVNQDPETGNPIVVAEDVFSGKVVKQPVDMVVLATGMVPSIPYLDGLLKTDADGFLLVDGGQRGIVAAGCVRRPVEVAESVRDATGAAIKALQASRG